MFVAEGIRLEKQNDEVKKEVKAFHAASDIGEQKESLLKREGKGRPPIGPGS